MRRQIIRLTCRDCGAIAVSPDGVTLHVTQRLLTVQCPLCGREIVRQVTGAEEDLLFRTGIRVVV